MSKTEIFLKSLDKYEISFLYKYKYDEYLQETQRKIILIIKEFELNEEIINSLVNERLRQNHLEVENISCKRCKSQKLFYYQEEVINENTQMVLLDKENYSGNMPKQLVYECGVCGLKSDNKIIKTNNYIKDISDKTIRWIIIVVIIIISIFVRFYFS